MVSGDFCKLNYHFVFFFVPNIFYFCVVSYFLDFFFFGLGKKTIKIGVSAIFGFVAEREERSPKKDDWNSRIWDFLVQKWPFRDAHLFIKKCFAETPTFVVFFGCALFGPSWQKREILDTHHKNEKND